jgi:hypothetical protein
MTDADLPDLTRRGVAGDGSVPCCPACYRPTRRHDARLRRCTACGSLSEIIITDPRGRSAAWRVEAVAAPPGA